MTTITITGVTRNRVLAQGELDHIGYCRAVQERTGHSGLVAA
jgi:hypothetical protein